MYKRRFLHHLLPSILFLCFSLFIVSLSHSASIYLGWDDNTEEGLSGYRLYYGFSSANYEEPLNLGNVTTYELSGLSDGTTYYLALTAYDIYDNESEKTDELIVIAQSTEGEEEQNTCDDPHQLLPVSVNASSESFFWSKDNAIDGDPRTFWSSSVTFFWTNQFITLDLGGIKQIDSIDMDGTELFGLDYFPTNFQIQISKDNINWEEIMNENDYSIQSSDTKNSWDFNTPEAQYIRVYITKAKTFFLFHLVQIAEIEVYGCDMPEHSPILFEESSLAKDEKRENDKQAASVNIPLSEQPAPTIPGRPKVTFK